MRAETTNLKNRLEELYITYDKKYLESDPLKFPHRYSIEQDREIAGLISSVLAYGKVKQIFNSVEKVLGIIGKSPYEFVLRFNPQKDSEMFSSFKHRFNIGLDISLLLYFLKQIYENYRTMDDYFAAGHDRTNTTIKEGLTNFCAGILDLDSSPFYKEGLPDNSGVRYFFASPANGSACKRLNLFLRWMVRKDDDLDFGIWKKVNPSQLVLPLDTHTSRLCSYIGLTERKTSSWLMAEEVTANLRKMSPDDPVKYDFAICRLGILDLCEHKYVIGLCEKCKLFDICSIV